MPDIFDLQDRASALMDLGRYHEAAKAAGQALAIDPSNLESLLLMSHCQLMLEQYDQCIELARSVLARSPSDSRALAVLSEAHAMRGEADLAIGYIRAALTHDMQNVLYLSQLSRYLVMINDEPAAVQMAVNALAIDPEFVPALSTLGWAKAEMEVYDEALEAFRRGLALEPNNAILLKQIGSLLSEAGAVEDAKSMFLDALRNDPNLDLAAIHLSDLRYRNTWLYRLHYKMVQLFRESHVSRIVFFAGIFLALVPVAEYAWEAQPVIARLLIAPAWFFLLVLLSPFIVPVAGKVPALFAVQYKHLFGWWARSRSILVLLLYLAAIGLIVASLCSSGLISRRLAYFSFIVLIACLPVLALLGRRIATGGRTLMMILAAGLYTWLWLSYQGSIRFNGFMGWLVTSAAGIAGAIFFALRRFRD